MIFSNVSKNGKIWFTVTVLASTLQLSASWQENIFVVGVSAKIKLALGAEWDPTGDIILCTI